jgi:hypothetical protein
MDNPVCRTIGFRVTVCAALLGFAAAVSAQTADWKPYSYQSDGFQASFPANPEVQRQDVSTESGSFELHSYTAQLGSVVAFVGVCDFGPKSTGRDRSELLQGTKQGVLINSSSHLVREKKIMIGIYPGLEFEGLGDSMQLTARIYMVGSVLYQTLVLSPLGNPYEDTAHFLDSFQLVSKTTN